MNKREQWDAGVTICVNDDDGQPLEYVPSSVYDRVVGVLQSKLREQNRILESNVSAETWAKWKREAA